MSQQTIIETCSSLVAICSIGGFIMDIVHPLVVVLSFVWLTLQIIHHVKLRIKEQRKRL